MSVDVELDSNTVIAGNSEINSEIDIEMSTNQEIEVYIEPREYKVVGDDVYIPINFDSAPTWLTQAITDLTNIKVTDVVTNLNSMINDLTYAVQQIEVAKNQYEQSITALNDIDSRFNSVLTTLNSNMDGLDASLKELIATKVTSTQASVVALNAITTAMNDTSTGSTLGSAILNLQTSITNLNTSTNTSLTSLESSINGAVDANAQAVEVINTYVGIDDAGASTGTGLSAYLEDSTGNIGGADSSVANSVYVDGLGNSRSKFEYNSNLSFNGYNYQSGFGIATNLTSSSIPVGQSEFWINASKFKFTNTNQTGQVSPFTIDATGANPVITFNGKVQFSNINNVPTINKTYVQASQPTTGMNLGDTWIDTDDNNSLYSYNGTTWNKTQSGNKTFLQVTAPTTGMIAGDVWVDSDNNYKQYRYSGSAWVEYLYNPATAINAGTTTIDGPKITTGSITASQISSASITADRLSPTTGTTTTWKGGGLVSNNFNGNADGAIGSPTAGFRLSSDAAGTSTDPTIYGAYIKGGTIDGLTVLSTLFNANDIKIKSISDATKSGRISYTVTSGSFVGSNYSTGYLANRVCSTTSYIVIHAKSSVNSGSWSPALFALLQYSISGGAWVTVDSGRFSISNSSNTAGGAEVMVSMFAIVQGSIIGATDTITFQVTASAPQGGTPVNEWIATVYNQ